MNANGLDVYLNDHLAGPAFAIPAARSCLAHASDATLASYLHRFLEQLEDERRMLHRILSELEISPNYLKLMMAWTAEKATQLKLTRVLRRNGELSELEQLELLRLGVQGKRGMWALLLELSRTDARLARFNLRMLLNQADAQVDALEAYRLKAGWKVAAPPDAN